MNSLKKMLMFFVLFNLCTAMMATTISIGTGTAVSKRPLACYFGYERSANLFLASEIGMIGNITDLAWYSTLSNSYSIPTKIYLKATSSTTLSEVTWAAQIAGATLVYNNNVNGTVANNWNIVDIDDWGYSGENLVVLIECNYGGQGMGSASGGAYTLTTMSTNVTAFLSADNTIPLGNTYLSHDRPNIRMNITSFTGPAVFNMTPSIIGFGQNFLNIASNPTNVTITNGGGTTMHIISSVLGGNDPNGFIVTDTNTYPRTLNPGNNMSFSVQFRPTSAQQYSATIIVTDDLSRTSHTLTLSGLGIDSSISTFPYTESFDETSFAPFGWSNYRIQGNGTPGTWDRQTAGVHPTCLPYSGEGMARYNSYTLVPGTQGALVSPPLNLPGSNYRVSFWMYRDLALLLSIYENEMVSVWLNSTPNLIGADSLGAIHRRWDLSPVENSSGWNNYQMSFPPTSAGIKYVIFKAISCYGNNMFLDDVTFEQQPVGPPFPATLISPLNGAVSQSITSTLYWLPDNSGSSPNAYHLSIGTDNPPTNILNNYDVSLASSYSQTLQYNTIYYWQVIPYNAEGQATNCPVWSFTTESDPTVISFPYYQNFDGVTPPAFPPGWSKIVTSTITNPTMFTTTSNPHSSPNNVLFYNSDDLASNVILITPPTANIGSTHIRFWARGASNASIIVGTVADPTNPSSFTAFETIPISTIYIEYSLSFAGYTGTDHYIGFKHGNISTYQSLYIDDFTWQLIPTGAQIDVNPTSLSYGEINNNSMSIRTVQITNSGLADLNFSMTTSAPSISTNINGTRTLNPGSSLECIVMLLPTSEGVFSGSITINSNDPQNPSLQILISATVLPALAPGLVEIGNGILVDYSLPMEPYYMHSFSQTIYLQQELNHPNSMISSIFYQYNGYSEWTDSVKVYMGLTNRIQFFSVTDYVPANELTLVYSGMLSVPAVAGWVELPLNEPFHYDNISNLVICVDKDMPEYHDDGDDFFCTQMITNRSIMQYSDQNNSSVTNPYSGILRMAIPDTRLQFQSLPDIPIFSAIPSTVDFGQVNINNTSSPINVQIHNIGGGSLIITEPISISGVDDAQFSLIDTNTYPDTLFIGESYAVSVTFTPTSGGIKNAQLNVTDNLTPSRKSDIGSRTLHVIPLTGYGNDGIIHIFPYQQGFEDETFPNADWSISDSGNPLEGWRRWTTAGYAHNGTAYAFVSNFTGNHWMMTPKFEVGSQSNQLRFWLQDSSDIMDSDPTSLDEYLKVCVSTTNADSSSFITELETYSNFDIPSIYQEMTVDLSEFSGQNIYLGFLRHSTGGKFIYMDDFTISTPPAANNPPTNLVAVIDSANVHLTWQIPVHQISDHLSGYRIYRNDSLIQTLHNPIAISYTDSTVAYGLYTYKISAFYGPFESVYSNSFTIEVTYGYPNLIFADSFDDYPDFTTDLGSWTNLDVDLSNTFDFDQVSFPNMSIPKAFMVFNPTSTDPPMTYLQARTGHKMLACFDSANPPNDDWLITPCFRLGTNTSISFWAKSYTASYGLEKFNLLVSLSDMNPASFISITGEDTVSVPAVIWTPYNYDLSVFDNRTVYIAIQCVSDLAAALLIDDFKIISTGGSVGGNDPVAVINHSILLGNYPNPFNPETSIRFNLKERGKVSVNIYNVRGQRVTTLLDDIRDPGIQSILWNGKDSTGHPVASGVYFYHMQAGNYTQTRKMVLLK